MRGSWAAGKCGSRGDGGHHAQLLPPPQCSVETIEIATILQAAHVLFKADGRSRVGYWGLWAGVDGCGAGRSCKGQVRRFAPAKGTNCFSGESLRAWPDDQFICPAP